MKQFTIQSALLSIAIMLIFSSCSGNSEKYSLVYNLNTGDVFEQLITMDMNLSQNIMGQSLDVATLTQIEASYHIKDVRDETIELDFMFDSMAMNMSMGTSTFSINSETESEFATLTNMDPMLKALTKLPFDMVMDKKGNVKSMKGLEQIMQSMLAVFDESIDEQTKQQLLAQFEQQFGSESMMSTFEQSMTIFPEHEVKVGESWKTSSKVNNGQVNMAVDMKTTLKSVNNDIAILESKGDFSTGDTPIVQMTNGMETKVGIKGKQTGITEIDLRTGWIVKSEIVQDMKSEVEIQGMKLPQNITNKITISGK